MAQIGTGKPQSADGGRPLTHVDAKGRARMVDVTAKRWTWRRARAGCRVVFGESAAPVVRDGGLLERAEGPDAGRTGTDESWPAVLASARLAGIQAAKQTSRLVPLCHPLAVAELDVRLELVQRSVDIEATAAFAGPTGVEMEALTACTVAALAVVGALLPTDPDVSIQDVAVWEKSGGRSGAWVRERGSRGRASSGRAGRA